MRSTLYLGWILFSIVALVFAGCIRASQNQSHALSWQSRGDAMSYLISYRIRMHQYDSAEIFKRDDLYYGRRKSSKNLLYTSQESAEHLLDSTVYIYSPTRHYTWGFLSGRPNGTWYYYKQDDSVPYYIKIFADGVLIKEGEVDRSKWR